MSPATLVVRRAILLAVTPLLLGSCGPAKQGKVATVGDRKAAETNAPAAPSVEVSVLEPGDEPRAPLRYRIPSGQLERLVMDVGVQMKLVVGDRSGSPRFTVRLTMEVEDRKGILAELSAKIASINTNITNMEATTGDRRGRIEMTIEIKDVKHLEKVIKSIRAVDGVLDVERAVRS